MYVLSLPFFLTSPHPICAVLVAPFRPLVSVLLLAGRRLRLGPAHPPVPPLALRLLVLSMEMETAVC